MASSPITLRLDNEMKRRIADVARRKHITSSEAVRQAVAAWVENEEGSVSAYDRLKDIIGTVHGDDPQASEDMGRKYSEALQARYREGQRRAAERKRKAS